MRVGVALGRLNPAAWLAVTELADELGYDFVSLPEHLVLPVAMSGSPSGGDHPPIPASTPTFDAWVLFGYLAARTTRIRFGTYVYNLGLRHPFVTARAVATLDVLSGGRVDVGVGVSWLAEEWDAVGLDFATRGRRVTEAAEVCRRLWTEPVVEHHGEFYDFAPVMFEPKPVQQPPPLLFGGDADVTLRRVAALGEGWVPLRTSAAELPAAVARLRRHYEEAGRPPDSARVVWSSGARSWDEVRALEQLGVTDVVVAPWERTSGAADGLRHLAAARAATA